MKLTKPFAAAAAATVAALLLSSAAARADAEKAKKKLKGMDYEPTESGFLKAVADGDKKAVGLFIEAGVTVNAKSGSGDTPLIEAAESGNADILGLLVKAGADPNLRNGDGRSALYYSVQGAGGLDPQGKALDVLLAAPNADLKTPYKHGASLLHLAVESDYDVGVTKLLAKGADVNAKDDNGQTPLGYASSFGRKKVIPVLLKAPGIDVNSREKDGTTLLMHAAENGEPDAGLALLKAGADAKAVAPDGSTALHRLCSVTKHNRKQFNVPEGPYLELLDALVAGGAPVNAKKKHDGATALLVAVPEGHVPTVTELIAKGANPNLANATGETPLLVASRDGDAAMVKALLDGKADPNAKDRVGRSALTLAKDYPDVVELLKAAGAKEGGSAKAPAKTGGSKKKT
jgi:ankyrin repeat protein